MVKETRVLQGESTTPVTPGDENFSIAPKTPATGHILEYRITYKNISEPQSGTDNIILNASDIRITEDGTDDALGNNWAKDNDTNGEIDTSNISGSATDSGGANIEFTPNGDQTGTTASTDVTKYVVVVSDDVAPQEMRTFTFQRRINGTGLTGTATTPTP
jgi:FlaG/FlaF family flagellin (archaellin)